MPTFDRSQGLIITTGYINAVDDVSPGGGSGAPPGLTDEGRARGQVGACVTLGKNEVKYDPTVGEVEEGTFQYVKTLSGDVVQPARGILAYWVDRTNYIVSTVDTTASDVAGVFLNTVHQGRYTVIQKFFEGGRAYVSFGANVVAAGEVCFPAADATGTANRNVAATPLQSSYFGVAHGAKSAGNIALVELFGGLH